MRVGLSVSGTSQRATVEHALALGAFDAVQATWNLHERSVEPALAAASAAGLTVYIKEGLANGRLAGEHAAPELPRWRRSGARRRTRSRSRPCSRSRGPTWC